MGFRRNTEENAGSPATSFEQTYEDSEALRCGVGALLQDGYLFGDMNVMAHTYKIVTVNTVEADLVDLLS